MSNNIRQEAKKGCPGKKNRHFYGLTIKTTIWKPGLCRKATIVERADAATRPAFRQLVEQHEGLVRSTASGYAGRYRRGR